MNPDLHLGTTKDFCILYWLCDIVWDADIKAKKMRKVNTWNRLFIAQEY